ncbi:MAG: efflux RND transporter periplasmic adaptor subunit [Bacteroidetes bacterium]|nr:efflux RND transporter periplasmic adaptor subunit [Bacteroidota bacterium]
MKKKLNNDRNYFFYLILLVLTLGSCSESKNEKHDEAMHKKLYTCSMHPQIIRDAPGKCPICGMDLVEKKSDDKVTLDVEMDDLIKPVDGYVLSSVKTISPTEKEVPIVFEVSGFISYDTRQFSTISSRYDGRIEKLYVKYNFQKVEKGQALFEMYSPELITAQQNLIFLLKNDETNTTLIESAKHRLSLLGMTKTQTEQLISTKQTMSTTTVYSPVDGYVIEEKLSAQMGSNKNSMGAANTNTDYSTQELSLKEGQTLLKEERIFKIVNTQMVWALLKLSGNQAEYVKKSDIVKIFSQSISEPISSPVDFVEPMFEGTEKYLTVHVHLHNTEGKWKVGDLISAEINGGQKKSLWINKESILNLGNETVVFLKEGNNFFKVRKVVTGITANNWIEVLEGISSNDSIADNAQYLIDSENFVKQ